jgi:hypothetical protein
MRHTGRDHADRNGKRADRARDQRPRGFWLVPGHTAAFACQARAEFQPESRSARARDEVSRNDQQVTGEHGSGDVSAKRNEAAPGAASESESAFEERDNALGREPNRFFRKPR